MVTVPLTVPGVTGENPRLTEQVFFGASETQLIVPEKELGPEIVPPLKVIVAPFFLGAVFVRVTFLVLVAPTRTMPKFTELGETFTAAETGVGVGVAVGVIVGVGVLVGVAVAVAV
jgi:hypothetical protein